jgi:hypothetical protein
MRLTMMVVDVYHLDDTIQQRAVLWSLDSVKEGLDDTDLVGLWVSDSYSSRLARR